MTNVNTTIDPDNSDEITIDISGITEEQRRLLKKSCGYTDQIEDPENPGEMINNPIPLIAFVLQESMAARVQKMMEIEDGERVQSARAEPSAVIGFI